MIELFKTGGPLFMGILTLEFIGVFFFAIRYSIKGEAKKSDLNLIRSTGVLALVTGVFAQLLGLFSAFNAIEAAGSVSPTLLASGLKVSMITTLYGALIFLISYLVWFFYKLRKT